MARSSTPTARASSASPATAQRWRRSTITRSCRSPIAGTAKTQIRWGIARFRPSAFGAPPEGMWLAETAVDVETLELLAAQDIRFVILAPHQAGRVRAIGERQWQAIDGDAIDPSRAYQQCLPSGRVLALFFYDGPIARAVAFEGVLSRRPLGRQTHWARFRRRPRSARSWSISPPMAKAMAIIIGLATWRWPTHSIKSKPNSWRA